MEDRMLLYQCLKIAKKCLISDHFNFFPKMVRWRLYLWKYCSDFTEFFRFSYGAMILNPNFFGWKIEHQPQKWDIFSYFQTQCCLWISERHFTVGKLPISSCLWVRGERSIMVAITNRRRSCLFPLVSNICVCFQYKEEERAHFHSPTKYNWKLAFFKIERGGPLLPVWNWLLVYFP